MAVLPGCSRGWALYFVLLITVVDTLPQHPQPSYLNIATHYAFYDSSTPTKALHWFAIPPKLLIQTTFMILPFQHMVLPNPNTKLHFEKHQEVGCGNAGDLHVTYSWGSWLLGLCGEGEGAVALRSDCTTTKLENT